MADFAELVKARLTFLVLITTAVGFYVGWLRTDGFCRALARDLWNALAAGGRGGAQSMVGTPIRRHHGTNTDAAIPAGRMSPREALIVGTILGVGGVVYLAIAVNLISALLAAATIVIYLFAYTPLKRISMTNTLVGAMPGALPPLIGWAAARNDLAVPPGVSSRFCSSGKCRTSSRSAGCIAKIMRAPVSSCSPVAIWKAAEETAERFLHHAPARRERHTDLVWNRIASLSAGRAVVRRAVSLRWRFVSTGTDLPTARMFSHLDHLSAAAPRRARPDQTMSTRLLSRRRATPAGALAWKATLVLIPLLTAAGLLFAATSAGGPTR